MTLLKNIPGLSRHASQAKPKPEVFDMDRVTRLMRETVALLQSYHSPGALDWLRSNRPDITDYLRQCEREIDKAIEAQDMAHIRKAMDAYREAHLRAFKVYETRPPVMDVAVQEGLF